MAKIALDLHAALDERRRSGQPGHARVREVAVGHGWRVADVICTSGPRDRVFEEQHTQFSVALVLGGTFQCRAANGSALLTPGSALLGMPGLCYECSHDHGAGDRCVAFWYAPDYFERLAADAGWRGPLRFATPRVPAVAGLAPVVTHAGQGITGGVVDWSELAVRVAATTLRLDAPRPGTSRPPPHLEARVSAAVRAIDRAPEAAHTLDLMAQAAGISPYHFLRGFQRVTGVTPHQYVLRARLRLAAWQLAERPEARVLDVALDSGFGDASHFDRAFRGEFGITPRAYRRHLVGTSTR